MRGRELQRGWDLASTGEELTFAQKGKTDRTAATHTHQQC